MGSPLYVPRFRAFDANGNPLASGKVYTYVAGTSTTLGTYSDADLTTPNANPVVLDANGEAAIFGVTNQAYKVVLKSSADVTQWTMDGVRLVGEFESSGAAGVNYLDNCGAELVGIPGRTAASATGAGATCMFDRWWGYRYGQTGYTIANVGSDGLPNGILMSRAS